MYHPRNLKVKHPIGIPIFFLFLQHVNMSSMKQPAACMFPAASCSDCERPGAISDNASVNSTESLWAVLQAGLLLTQCPAWIINATIVITHLSFSSLPLAIAEFRLVSFAENCNVMQPFPLWDDGDDRKSSCYCCLCNCAHLCSGLPMNGWLTEVPQPARPAWSLPPLNDFSTRPEHASPLTSCHASLTIPLICLSVLGNHASISGFVGFCLDFVSYSLKQWFCRSVHQQTNSFIYLLFLSENTCTQGIYCSISTVGPVVSSQMTFNVRCLLPLNVYFLKLFNTYLPSWQPDLTFTGTLQSFLSELKLQTRVREPNTDQRVKSATFGSYCCLLVCCCLLFFFFFPFPVLLLFLHPPLTPIACAHFFHSLGKQGSFFVRANAWACVRRRICM